jgi:hypothetical protein
MYADKYKLVCPLAKAARERVRHLKLVCGRPPRWLKPRRGNAGRLFRVALIMRGPLAASWKRECKRALARIYIVDLT